MFVSWTISMPKLHWLVVVKVQLFNISLRMWVNSKSCQNANCDWVDIKNIKVIGPNNSQVKSGKKPINKSTSLFYYGTCARKYLNIDRYFLFPSASVLQCRIKWLSISIIISIIHSHTWTWPANGIYLYVLCISIDKISIPYSHSIYAVGHKHCLHSVDMYRCVKWCDKH